MAILVKLGFCRLSSSSLTCVASNSLRPTTTTTTQLNYSRGGPCDIQRFRAQQLRTSKVIKSCQFIHGVQKVKKGFQERKNIGLAISEDQSDYMELDPNSSDEVNHFSNDEETSLLNTSVINLGKGDGKSGQISFYNRPYKREDEVVTFEVQQSKSNVMWLVGPAILVAFFVFPSLYLRKILSKVFEDSLLTDFLILFFTEALFYCGVALFLVIIDRARRPMKQDQPAANIKNPKPQMGQRILYIVSLVLSLVIPMVTMGLVWPWTGPAASATLAPYLVGIVVQFTFEQYARRRDSPAWSAIPIIFQVYRLHQLNRAAQLVNALSFTVRGAEMTSNNLAINNSLSMLLNVLQLLGIISIWSLSSFLVRYSPTSDVTS
ncbi:hypothetical protein ACFE04_017764 [Oxalis oulophora]